MTVEPTEIEDSQWVSARQGGFIRYTLHVLVDLTVLNLFVEYWDRVIIDSFTISLFTAALLQVLLKATLAIEHRITHHYQSRSGTGAMIQRVLATWAVLFGSKFAILEAVDILFGDHVDLGGLVPFIVLVVALLAAQASLPASTTPWIDPSSDRDTTLGRDLPSGRVSGREDTVRIDEQKMVFLPTSDVW